MITIRLKTASCLCITFIFMACMGKKTSSDTSTSIVENKKDIALIPSIDITKEYPKRDFNIQEIADIEYIPLETTNEVLLEGGALSNVAISKEFIVTCNLRAGTMFVFSRSGKICHHFNHKGDGKYEYQSLSKFCVDFDSNEIYIWDHLLNYKILVYSFNGDFKRILKVNAKIWPEILMNYDDQSLLCYDTYNLDYEGEKTKLNDRPYALISKKTGKVYPLNLIIKNRIGNSLHSQQYGSSSVDIYSILKGSEEIILSDFALDTVYSFKNETLHPIAIHNRKIKEDDTFSLVSILMKTNEFIFWDIIEKKIVNHQLTPKRKILLQSCSTGEVWQPLFYNLDYAPKQRIRIPDAYMADLPENYARRSLSPEMLTELYQKGELTGKLKEAASKLKADDNPVLMLAKFKE